MKLITVSLSTGVVPSFFKHSVVEPTHKKPSLDPSTPKSYRQISNLPFISKIFEKVVTEQHLTFLENHDVCDTFQTWLPQKAFQQNGLLHVSSHIMMSADSGEYTILIILDLSSAFDTVDHVSWVTDFKILWECLALF